MTRGGRADEAFSSRGRISVLRRVSVQQCMNLYGRGFVYMDSDIVSSV